MRSRHFGVALGDERFGEGESLLQFHDQRLALVGIDLGCREPRLHQRPFLDALGEHLAQLARVLRDARVVDRRPQRACRIALHVLAHLAQIIGIEVQERLARTHGEREPFSRKAHGAFVIDEHVAGQDIAPAGAGRAQAEVVLLAVAAPEPLRVEQPHLVEAGAPYAHAEAHGRRQIDGPAGVGRREETVERREPERCRARLPSSPRRDTSRSWRCWRTA